MQIIMKIQKMKQVPELHLELQAENLGRNLVQPQGLCQDLHQKLDQIEVNQEVNLGVNPEVNLGANLEVNLEVNHEADLVVNHPADLALDLDLLDLELLHHGLAQILQQLSLKLPDHVHHLQQNPVKVKQVAVEVAVVVKVVQKASSY